VYRDYDDSSVEMAEHIVNIGGITSTPMKKTNENHNNNNTHRKLFKP